MSTTSFRDETGYDAHYGSREPSDFDSVHEFVTMFEEHFMRSFPDGAWVFDGKALSYAVARLRELAESSHILDCGSGPGLTSLYLSQLGFRVTGVEISSEGVRLAESQRDRLGLECNFRSSSLEDTGLPDNSVDAFFGRNTLHHFIKYPNVANELRRVATPGAIGYFVDPWAENLVKNGLFHTKSKRALMDRLGDALLTSSLVRDFFSQETVELIPVAWFSMLDKAYMRLSKKLYGEWKFTDSARRLARVHDMLDNRIPHNRLTLWLSGTVITQVAFASRSGA